MMLMMMMISLSELNRESECLCARDYNRPTTPNSSAWG